MGLKPSIFIWKGFDFRIESMIPKPKLVGLARHAPPTGGAADIYIYMLISLFLHRKSDPDGDHSVHCSEWTCHCMFVDSDTVSVR